MEERERSHQEAQVETPQPGSLTTVRRYLGNKCTPRPHRSIAELLGAAVVENVSG